MFVILAFQRSGTHMLASLLNSHPDLTCYDEVLLQPSSFTTLGRKRYSELGEREGCIIMYSHALRLSPEEMNKLKQAKIIHLARNDIKSHAQSIAVTGGSEFTEQTFRKIRKRVANFRALALSTPFEHFFTISYEEICRNKNVEEYENKELLEFLGVQPMKLTTSFKKGRDPINPKQSHNKLMHPKK